MKNNENHKQIAILDIASTILIAAISVSSLAHYTALQSRKDIKLKIKEVQLDMFMIEKQQDKVFRLLEEIKADQLKNRVITLPKVKERFVSEAAQKTTEVLFINYYIGDEMNSADITASGLSVDDLIVDDKGFYTYDDRIVVATVNETRLDYGLFNGYKSHELYEELQIELNGQIHEAIFLDVCGACYGVESKYKQRYDIMTTSNVFGKVEGLIYE